MTAARHPAASLASAWALAPSIGRAVARGVSMAVREVLREGARRRGQRADLRQLHAMGAHELRDLGLSRADLPALPQSVVLGDDWRSWHQLPR